MGKQEQLLESILTVLTEMKQLILLNSRDAMKNELNIILGGDVKINLKAKSGYTSTETHSISLYQWNRINLILNEK